MLNRNDWEKIRKILSIDGKIQCGNGNDNQKANHIVSALDEHGFCLGEESVDDNRILLAALILMLKK